MSRPAFLSSGTRQVGKEHLILHFNFHTHIPQKNALVSAEECPVGTDFWSLELHPWFLPETFEIPDASFKEKLRSASAVGEIGLDRLRGPELSVQRAYFRTVLKWAEEAGKGVVVHAVRCDAELDFELRNFSGKVLIHGFCSGEKRLLHHLELNRFVSFAPGGWRHCVELLHQRGLKNIGLETDDSNLRIEDVYIQAEKETAVSGWECACADNFLQFIG